MAPEQAFEEAPTVAADWYSVGVMLYEALVGVPPFVGSAFDVIQRKNDGDPRPPAESRRRRASRSSTCSVARSSIVRPNGDPGGRRSSSDSGPAEPQSGSAPTRPRAISLVGREPQVAELEAAQARANRGHGVTVRVSGRAGMGKSALAQAFLDRAEQGGAVVLRGRAYERESLPYKAVDGVIDALSRHLVHLADHGDTLAFPSDIGALVRLFPVLRRVPVLDRLPEEPLGDPARTRRRAFGALREVLGKLARRRSLILYVDDAQWGDTDSATLLLESRAPAERPAGPDRAGAPGGGRVDGAVLEGAPRALARRSRGTRRHGGAARRRRHPAARARAPRRGGPGRGEDGRRGRPRVGRQPVPGRRAGPRGAGPLPRGAWRPRHARTRRRRAARGAPGKCPQAPGGRRRRRQAAAAVAPGRGFGDGRGRRARLLARRQEVRPPAAARRARGGRADP